MRILLVLALAFVALACEKTVKEARTSPERQLQIAAHSVEMTNAEVRMTRE